MIIDKMHELDDFTLEDENLNKPLPILPLRNSVLFPGTLMPLTIGRPRSLEMFKTLEVGSILAIVTQHDHTIEEPEAKDLYGVGTIARILKIYPDTGKKTLHVAVQGIERIRSLEFVQSEPYFIAQVEQYPVHESESPKINALCRSLREMTGEAIDMVSRFPEPAFELMDFVETPDRLAYSVISNLPIPVDEKQELLEENDVLEILNKALRSLSGQIEVLKISKKINSEVTGELNKSQREYYLRQQLKAIRKELGEDEDEEEFIDEIRARLHEVGLPEEVQKIANKELRRLKNIQPASPEYTVVRTYLECFADLPWNVSTTDNHDIDHAKEVLDRDHYGLEKVKKRILEFLAVNSLRKDGRSPILCLVGPPGVGKTSLGKSIAEAVDRNYQRISLGGISDESDIRGHRRTYIGSMPGRFIESLKRAGSNNPVLVLDEIDKMGRDWKGDPTSALLEVLDPEQNSTFTDHYLNVPFDLSKVMFIATSNNLEGIPRPLLDRMEVIEVSSYIVPEKMEIAKRHLIPKQIDEHGLKSKQVKFQDDALERVIVSYTREAGVRNLEREIATICRRFAVDFVAKKRKKINVSCDDVKEFLGQEKHIPDVAERTKLPGVSTGLAWTPVGGDILFIEATMTEEGKGNLKLTGNLGDVMKESAELAMSYLKTNAKSLEISPKTFSKNDFHVHVPQGAIPKDGPSAGITMITSLASIMMGVRARGDLAMTGEITLRGNVLPVGGVREKVLAAHRAGIKHVVLPERNEKDLDDIPESVKEELEFHFVSHLDEVLDITLQKK